MEIHAVTLIKMLAKAIIIFPERISSTVSKLKVEKVLKPPQKPTTISIRRVGFAPNFSLKKPTASARTIQLITLEQSVAIGKTDLKFVFTNSEMPYLTMLPKPPPKKTKSKLFILLTLKSVFACFVQM